MLIIQLPPAQSVVQGKVSMQSWAIPSAVAEEWYEAALLVNEAAAVLKLLSGHAIMANRPLGHGTLPLAIRH